MNIKHIYIGLTLISGLATTLNLCNPAPISAQTPQEIQKIAREITVRISADATQGGSGVIIAKQGNTYYLATAAHVVDTIDSYTAVTHDGKSHPINSVTIKKFQNNVDLAVVSFESDRNYPVAKISRYLAPTYERRSINSGIFDVAAIANQQQAIFVSGFPNFEDTRDSGKTYVLNPGQIIDTSGSAISDPSPLARGYRLTYSNLTHQGMSGGAVLDANARLIAIHGRNDGIKKAGDRVVERTLDEAKKDFRVHFGNSIGIPITTFLELLPSTGLQLNLQTENTAPRVIPISKLDSWMPPITADARVNPVYWINRGNQLWRIGKIREAQADFDRAIQLTDKSFDKGIAWYAKGFVSGFNRDYQEALRSCTRAVELSPETYDGWRCKAGAEYRTGKYSEALSSIDRAIELNKKSRLTIAASNLGGWRENPTDYTERGEILFVLGRASEAIASFRKAIELSDDRMAGAWSNMGFVQMKTGDFSAAETSIDRAIALDPKFAAAWSNRGRLFYERKRYLESVAAYDEAAKLNPQDPEIWVNRGAALYFAGNKSQALQSVKQSLAIDPNYKPAVEMLRAIEAN